MKSRFIDLLLLDVPKWAIHTFMFDGGIVDFNIQEKLIDLTCDLEAQTIYTQNGYLQFYTKKKKSGILSRTILCSPSYNSSLFQIVLGGQWSSD